MQERQASRKRFWEEGGGFFGRPYMEGDNSIEGYLSTPLSLEERTRIELDGVIRLLELRPGQRILDCPCGYGRHSNALARLGFEVVGSDINGEMLAPAIKAAEGISNVRYVKENMQDLAYRDEFDAVINLFFSFGFFETEEENDAVLRNFYDALKPGGKFMMHTDINVPRLFSGTYKLHEKRSLKSGKQLEIIESFDPPNRRLTGQWIIISPDGAREECTPYSHRIYTFEDFAEHCVATGFRNVKGYGGWDGSPLTEHSEDMMVVAEKPLLS
jgi:2-polyprenyl-3-methyl-5-hydroxy-6-metoxy-1,4-benzoquinol methylase